MNIASVYGQACEKLIEVIKKISGENIVIKNGCFLKDRKSMYDEAMKSFQNVFQALRNMVEKNRSETLLGFVNKKWILYHEKIEKYIKDKIFSEQTEVNRYLKDVLSQFIIITPSANVFIKKTV